MKKKNIKEFLGDHGTLMTGKTSITSELMENRDQRDKNKPKMRLGTYACKLKESSKAHEIYGSEIIYERHRHRYEYNLAYKDQLESKGMICSGISPDERLVEIIELEDHPWFVGVQYHAEFKSRPTRPHPLFRDFIKSAYEYRLDRK